MATKAKKQARKAKRHKQRREAAIDSRVMDYREIGLRASSINEEARSVEILLATEAPVEMFDWARMDYVPEVLLNSGAEWPGSRQVPLLTNHKHEIGSQAGSVQGLRRENAGIVGRAVFSSTAETEWTKVREGHITDVSVGYRVLERQFIPKGERQTIDGRSYEGPLNVVTKYRILEGSIVPIGADEQAKLRGLDPASLQREEEFEMDKELRALLVKAGMDKETSDDDASRWLVDNFDKVQEVRAKVEKATKKEDGEHQRDYVTSADLKAFMKEYDEQQRAERDAFRSEVDELLELFPGYEDLKTELYRCESLAEVRTTIKDAQSKRQGRPLGIGRVDFGPSENDKWREVALNGLTMRMTSGRVQPEDQQAARDAQPFRGYSLRRLLLETAQRRGERITNPDSTTTLRQLVKREFAATEGYVSSNTFDHNGNAQRASDGAAFHVTGTFANLLLDASNKSIVDSYERVAWATTYQIWARQGSSVPDFKQINRVKMGEVGNTPVVPEGDDYKDLAISDAREFYKIEKHGHIVSLTWETIVNDDLDAFSRVVELQSASMRRTLNKSIYQILFDNPTMNEDSQTLFDSSNRTDFAGSTADNDVTTDISAAALDTAYTTMMMWGGLNTDVPINVAPRYILHNVGDTNTIWQILNSSSIDATANATNPELRNLYGPSGPRRLISVPEPLITANDADSWYLAADPMEIDTIEYTFLQGEETPVLEQETGFTNDSVKFKIRQTWGASALDYRGLYRSLGSG